MSSTGAYAQDAAHGAELAALARCTSCHTGRIDDPFGGGYAIHTDFGTFYGTNLTPDPNSGLGGWSLSDFTHAMRDGRSPEGKPYYPAFPYASFTHMDDADLADLYAWLKTLPQSASQNKPHDLKFLYRGRWILRIWQTFNLRSGPEATPADMPVDVERGRYLVNGPGHCGECHSPRNAMGGMVRKQALGGNDAPPEAAPDIQPDRLASWGQAGLVSFLEDGVTPDGDVMGGLMRGVILEGTAKLSPEDRAAIAAYLLYVPTGP